MGLSREDINILRNYGYCISVLAEDLDIDPIENKYIDLVEYLKANHLYYYLLYVDLEIKAESEKIFLEEDMQTKRKNFKSRWNKQKKELIKAKYGITR